MKEWMNPELKEINISDTQYGGRKIWEFDDIYVNSEGNWEGTFKES